MTNDPTKKTPLALLREAAEAVLEIPKPEPPVPPADELVEEAVAEMNPATIEPTTEQEIPGSESEEEKLAVEDPEKEEVPPTLEEPLTDESEEKESPAVPAEPFEEKEQVENPVTIPDPTVDQEYEVSQAGHYPAPVTEPVVEKETTKLGPGFCGGLFYGTGDEDKETTPDMEESEDDEEKPISEREIPGRLEELANLCEFCTNMLLGTPREVEETSELIMKAADYWRFWNDKIVGFLLAHVGEKSIKAHLAKQNDHQIVNDSNTPWGFAIVDQETINLMTMVSEAETIAEQLFALMNKITDHPYGKSTLGRMPIGISLRIPNPFHNLLEEGHFPR